MREARVSVYPVTVHCRPDSDEPRSRPMDGRATWTAVESRKAMPDARTVTTTSQRPGVVPSATEGRAWLLVTGAPRPRPSDPCPWLLCPLVTWPVRSRRRSADDEVGEEVRQRCHGTGRRQGDDPRENDI